MADEGARSLVRVSAEAIERYAEAVGDANPAHRAGPGQVAPPLYPFVCGWEALAAEAARVVPVHVVHLGQDMRLERPLRAGEVVSSRARLVGSSGDRAGRRFVFRVRVSGEGRLLADSWTTLFARGAVEPFAWGAAIALPAVRSDGEVVACAEQPVPRDRARRYADASGDGNAIHLDDHAALAAGLPGAVLHGMCTLAMACAAAVQSLCAGEPARLRRFAGRFSRPVLPGATLRTTFFRTRGNLFAFESRTDSGPAVKQGLAEVAVDASEPHTAEGFRK